MATKTFSCWSLTVKPRLLAYLLEVCLHHANVPAGGNFNLADEHELRAIAVAVKIDNVDVLAGQILAEAADDAGLIFAEAR